jgi:hypothetical protein
MQIVPFQQNGKPNVFLPTKEQTKYAVVKHNIAKNKEAKKFLEDLGLTTPDIFAEINEFILPKLRKGESYPDYFDDLCKVIDASQTQHQEKRKRLIQDLKECPFIIGYNPETGETKCFKYDSLYYKNEVLNTYFGNSLDVYYVAEKQYELFLLYRTTTFLTLLKEIGVVEFPRRIQTTKTYLTIEERKKLRSKSDLPNYTWERITDYDLHGLNSLFDNICLERSLALWNILESVSEEYLHGKYEWYNLSSHIRTKSFEAKFLSDLKRTPWLYHLMK